MAEPGVTQLKSDLNSLQVQDRTQRTLSAIEAKGARPATTGRGTFTKPSSTGTGGIASPLTETSFAARTYYDEVTITSSDGLLIMKVKPIRQVTSKDANGAEVVQIYAQPPATGTSS